jgi:hypothetical protein
MITRNLIQRLETNWEQIAAQVIRERNNDPDLLQYKTLSDREIQERAKDLSSKLSSWLLDPDETRFIAHFEALGRRRCEEGIPLHEVIQKLNIIKRAIRRYVTEQNYSLTPLEIYQELEVLRAMAGFFDFVVFRVAKGYEETLRAKLESKPATVLSIPWQSVTAGLLG